MNETIGKTMRLSFGGDRVAALPVVWREIKVTAQRAGFYWTRFSVALLSIIFTAYALFIFEVGRMSVSNLGGTLFQICSVVGFYYCIIAGLRNTADCISFEKREGTLGLLLLTDLKGYDVILGKLSAVGLKSFYGLMAGFPALAISIMLGGVTGAQFWKTALVLLNVLFLAHAIGLTTSGFSTEVRQANRNAILAAAAIFIGIPWAEYVLSRHGHMAAAQIMRAFIPTIDSIGIARHNPYYWISLLGTQAMGWGLLAFASWRLPFICQQRGGKVRWRWAALWERWRYGSVAARARTRQKLLDQNPYFWLTSRAYRKPLIIWIGLGLLAALWLWIWVDCTVNLNSPNSADWKYAVCTITATLLYLLTVPALASEACFHLAQQRQNGSLEMILCSTPLQVSAIIAGYWKTLRRQFLWPILTVVVVDIAFAVAVPFFDVNDRQIEISLYIFYIASLLIIDSIAVAWLGMWLGLSSKPGTAFTSTIGRVMVLPLLLMITLLIATTGHFGGMEFAVLLGLIKLIADAFYIIWAKNKLLENLRLLAPPQAEPRGIFAILGRMFGTKVAEWKAADRKANPSF